MHANALKVNFQIISKVIHSNKAMHVIYLIYSLYGDRANFMFSKLPSSDSSLHLWKYK